MNAETVRWSHRYRKALRRHLGQIPGVSPLPALRLGRQAVALGLETLDLARTHDAALTTLVSPRGSPATRQEMIERARIFFAEAVVPVEKTHRAAIEDVNRVLQLAKTLRRRTAESSASTLRLKRTIRQRRDAEKTLERSGKQHASLLAKARHLQAHLRHLTREILMAQEDGRQKMSCRLHDEIGQTLLGIHVRLLALRRAAKANSDSLKKEIVHTQRLVVRVGNIVKRFDHEFVIQRKT